MRSSGKFQPLSNQPRGVLLLVLVAAVGSGAVFLWNSQNAPARSRIDAGITYLASGQVAAAQSQWQEATRLDPTNTQAWELLGDLYFNTHDYKAAQNAFSQAVELGTTSQGIEAKAAYSALQVEDLKDARRFADKALSHDNDDVRALEVLAEVEERENHPDIQLQLLQRVAALQPESGAALLAVATELALNEKFEQLLPVAQKLVKLEPDTSTSYFLRGLANFNASPSPQTDAQAKADFLKVLELSPVDAEAHRFLARLYLRQNRPHEAVQQFKEVGRLRPFATVHLFELSQALRLDGKTREADETQRLFSHLKQVNQQILDLQEQANLSPQDPAPVLQLTKLLLSCIQGQDADFQLLRYRYLNNQVKSVGEYTDKTMRLAHPGTSAKEIGPQVETIYKTYLRVAQEKLQRRNFAEANHSMARAILMRPQDARTLRALEIFRNANQDPLGELPPPSPNGAFFK